MDLRDFIATHVAAALSTRMERPSVVAARAYDIAEALVAERAHRGLGAWVDPMGEGALEPEELTRSGRPPSYYEALAGEGYFAARGGLLDEPAPMSEPADAAELEDLESRAEWQADPKWGPLFGSARGPGLVKTSPEEGVSDGAVTPARKQA